MNQTSAWNSLAQKGNGIQFKYLVLLSTIFSSTWLISDIAAIKLINIWGITLTGSFIIFPITNMLISIIVEVYGYKSARQTIWSGFILNISYVIFLNLINIIPASNNWKLNTEFQTILMPETRIIIASVFSFLLADFVNSYLMAKMKIKTKGASLYKRIFIASSISFSIDIVCFITISFYKTMPNYLLIKLILAAYIKKILCQLILFPMTLYLIRILKKAEAIEVFDFTTKFNPFSFDNLYEFNFEQRNKVDKISSKEPKNVFY